MNTFNAKKKQILISEMEAHLKADNIAQGKWFDSDTGKGCHIGCCGSVFGLPDNSPNWQALSKETGVPIWCLTLSERIFERLSVEESRSFSLDFVSE